VKLTPEQRVELLNEMRLAEIFNTKMWSRRFGISPRTVKRLRAELRGQPTGPMGATAPNGPATAQVLPLNAGSAKRRRA
jgi:hypothetical protein